MAVVRPYIFFTTMALLFGACGNHAATSFSNEPAVLNKQLLAEAKAVIRSGDVLLRSGKDFTSYRIRELSDKDKTYSHAGIAYVQDTSVFVYNITPPDLDEPASDTAMRKEPLEKFADPSRCFGFGVIRYQLSETEIAVALHYLDSLYAKKTSFDHFFDLEDQNKMYCSEMVDYTLRYASKNRIALARKYFTAAQAPKAARYFHRKLEDVKKTPYISIDNIQLNASCTPIHNYVFIK